MEFVELKRGDAKASICKYGATVTSWSVKGEELIFVSPKAVMDGTKAIRGGVPICWPSFGPWSEGPQHGFARSSLWSVDEESRTETRVTLELGGSELWPGQKFKLRYKVSLAEDNSLELELSATAQKLNLPSGSARSGLSVQVSLLAL